MPGLTLAAVRAGGKAALAQALAQLEQAPETEAVIGLLGDAYCHPIAHVVGLTGPPGVGKSTLMNGLIQAWRSQARRIGCIAVDPSSRRSGGALLGDRTRLTTDPDDQGVFIRSMAARDRLGGLAAQTGSAMVLMRALYDMVLIETVGVGQSETDVAEVADTVVFCVQPGSGDSLQFLKAGIVEIPDVVVVTKADLGAAAQRAKADMEGALGLSGQDAVPVLLVSVRDGHGVEALAEAIDAHRTGQADRLKLRRLGQAEQWLAEAVRARFGTEGLRRAGDLSLAEGDSPFRRLADLTPRLIP